MTPEGPGCRLMVCPLFETVEDQRKSAAIMDAFLSCDVTRNSIGLRGKHTPVPVMLGYSDSAKGAGLFASHWRLHVAQYDLADVAAKHNVRLQFFHGRGGTTSRGAGPTHRFLDSLSMGSFSGAIRVTEQGETISQKYGNVSTAVYNLELLVAGATATLIKHRQPYEKNQDRIAAADRLSDYSAEAYTALVSADGFLAFWSEATPIDALEQSFIGSRPSRRTGSRTLDDLRAIPWVFSWLQARYYLPAWYGLGAGLEKLQNEDPTAFGLLQESVRDWPFMRYVLYNAETALASANLEIMNEYAALVGNTETRERFYGIVAAEYERTERMINHVFQAPRSERRPRMVKTLAMRDEALRRLHRRQIHLLKEWRALRNAGNTPAADTLYPTVLLSINAIASGERTTG